MYTLEVLYNLSPGARHAQQTIRISKRLSACKQILLKEIVIKIVSYNYAHGQQDKKHHVKNSNPVEIAIIVRS